jgi:hypothetical protein
MTAIDVDYVSQNLSLIHLLKNVSNIVVMDVDSILNVMMEITLMVTVAQEIVKLKPDSHVSEEPQTAETTVSSTDLTEYK